MFDHFAMHYRKIDLFIAQFVIDSFLIRMIGNSHSSMGNSIDYRIYIHVRLSSQPSVKRPYLLFTERTGLCKRNLDASAEVVELCRSDFVFAAAAHIDIGHDEEFKCFAFLLGGFGEYAQQRGAGVARESTEDLDVVFGL